MNSSPEGPTPPSRASRWLQVVPWLVAAGGLYVVGLALQGEAMPEGEPAPALSVTLGEGMPFDLAEQRGKVVVLNFWADWCPPCRAEAPALTTVARELERDGGMLVGLAVEERSLPSAPRLGMHYPQGYANPALAEAYQVSMLPTTVVVAPDGLVSKVFVGEVREDALRDAVRQAHGS